MARGHLSLLRRYEPFTGNPAGDNNQGLADGITNIGLHEQMGGISNNQTCH